MTIEATVCKLTKSAYLTLNDAYYKCSLGGVLITDTQNIDRPSPNSPQNYLRPTNLSVTKNDLENFSSDFHNILLFSFSQQ